MRRADAPAGLPGLLVTSWVPGERGDLVVARLAAAGTPTGSPGWARHRGGAPPRWRGCRCCGPGPFVDADLRWAASPTAAWPTGSPPRLARWPDRGAHARWRRWPGARRTSWTRVRRTLPGAQRPQPQERARRPRTRSRSPASSTGSSPMPGIRGPTSATCCASSAHPAYVAGVLGAWTTRRGGSGATRAGRGPGGRPVGARGPGGPRRRQPRGRPGRDPAEGHRGRPATCTPGPVGVTRL